MSTLRISNIEAKADSSSPTVDEQLKFTNSDGDLMLYLDGRTAGITTVGINTTNSTIKFDANNNILITGIVTATEFHGTLAVGTSVTYGDNEKAYFGNGLDLQIFHNTSDSVISQSAAGTGNLKILSGGAQSIECVKAGAVKIAHNGNDKIETTNTGAVVTGILTATNRVHATSMRIANDNFAAAGNADELILGDTSGNRGLTIVSGNTGIGALFFADDGQTNIGSLVYEHNTNQMRMVVNGAQVMRLDNTSMPTWIYGTDTNTYTSLPAADTIAFTTGGTERLRIGSNGSVGIGTDYLSGNASVYHKLMVEGDTTSTIAVAKIVRKNSSASNSTYTFEVDSSAHGSNMTSGGAMSVDVYSGRAFTINGNGNVGVGTDNPGALLTAYGSPAELRLQHTGNGSYSRLISDSSNKLKIYTGGGPHLGMIIDGSQNVGIGTDNPAERLVVQGDGFSNLAYDKDGGGFDGTSGGALVLTGIFDYSGSKLGLMVDNAGQGRIMTKTGQSLYLGTNNTRRVSINNIGYVGIKTTNALAHLDLRGVSGSGAPTMAIHHSNADVEGEVIRIGRTDLNTIRYHSIKAKHGGATANNYIAFNLHDTTSVTSQTESLRLTPTEINAKVPITGAVPAPNRNIIENGEFLVSQRMGDAASTKASSGSNIQNGIENGIVDRWRMGSPSASNFSRQRVTDAPSGFAYSFKVTNDGTQYNPGNANYSLFQQIIEAPNVARLAFGTSSAKTVTLSFYVKSSYASSTWAVALGSLTGGVYTSATRTYIKSYSISSANTWERKTITFPGDTSGTWPKTGTGGGLAVVWDLGSGGNHQGTSQNTWASSADFRFSGAKNVGDAANGSWQITGIQLEIGDTATEYEHIPIQKEIERCQRYFYCSGLLGSGSWNSSNTFHCAVHHPVAMRGRVTVGGTRSGGYSNINIEPRDQYDITVFDPDAHTHHVPDQVHSNQVMNFTISGSTTTGYSGTVAMDRNSDQFWLSAEL